MQRKIIITTVLFFVVVDVVFVSIALTMTPLQLKRNCFTYEYGEMISTKVEDYVNANINIIKGVQLDLSQVSTDVGKYKAAVSYFDKRYPFEIEVVDTVKPKAQLKNIEVKVKLGDKIKAKDLIKKVEDYSQTTVYFYDEQTKQKLKSKSFIEEGSFIDKIVVEDKHGNQSATLRVKIVVSGDTIKPKLEGVDDMTIALGSSFDPLFEVTATDNRDGNITRDIVVKGIVNTNQVGIYVLEYSVEDSAGNKIQVTRKVVVE